MIGWIKNRRSARAGAVLALAAVLLAGAVFLYLHDPYQYPLPCALYLLTGFYCPGCGAGRAAYSILHGQFYEAFCYNPLMVMLLPFLGLYFVVRGLDWVVTGGNHVDGKISAKLLMGILILVLIYGVLRNIPVFPFDLLAPGGMKQIG